MTKKIFTLCFLILCVTLIKAQEKPNVVFILADDLGTGDISFNNNDPSWFRHTPNIDKICEQGIYLRNYSVHHVCSPTRAGLLTGMHYSKVGSGSETGGTLHNHIPNVAKDFKANGYVTGAFGKWHNGYPCAPIDGNYTEDNVISKIDSSDNIWQKKKGQEWGEGVNAYGFDKWTGYHSGGGDYFNRYVNQHKEKDWWVDQHYRPDVTGYTTDLIGEAATEFIENNKDTSFYCYVPMEAVHGPYHAKLSDLQELCSHFPGEWDYIKDIKSPSTGRKISEVAELRCNSGEEFDHWLIDPEHTRFMRLIYSTMVYSMDKAVGKMLAKLDEHNLTDNTIVFFSSDNGATFEGSNSIFQGNKHSLWEGGIHVPAAIYWPGKIDATSLANYSVGDNDYKAHVQYIDYYPTIMSLTNSTISATNLDGVDFSEGLKSRTDSRAEFESPYFGIDSQWGVIKSGSWKLHYNEVKPEQILQLYNLDNDPGEVTNLADEEKGITETLKSLYNNWVEENNYAFSYLPVSKDKINDLTAEPSGDILEIKATQIDTIGDGFFIRFSNFGGGGSVAGDRIEFDIFVPDDSENDAGFHFSPGGGVAPYYVSNRAVTQDSVNLNTKKWPRNQWVRNVVGYGNHAPIGGYANYVCFVGTEPGITHFYLDNMIVRHSDGSTGTIWKDGGDFGKLEYRYQNTKYNTVNDAKSAEGFAFSDVKLTTVNLDEASFQVKNSIDDVTLIDTKQISLDGVFEVINKPSANIEISVANWTNSEFLNVEYNKVGNSLVLERKPGVNGMSEVTIAASYQGKTINTSFNVNVLTPDGNSTMQSATMLARIYPNPAHNKLYVSCNSGNFSVNLYNAIGQKVVSSYGQSIINIAGLQQGIYFVEIKIGEYAQIKKLQIN